MPYASTAVIKRMRDGWIRLIISVGATHESLLRNLLLHDPCPCFAFKGPTDIFRVGDQRLFAAILHEPNDGLYLWSHRAFCKVCAFGKILFCFFKSHLVQPLLLGLAKV